MASDWAMPPWARSSNSSNVAREEVPFGGALHLDELVYLVHDHVDIHLGDRVLSSDG